MKIEIPEKLIKETIEYWNDETYPLKLAKYVISPKGKP